MQFLRNVWYVAAYSSEVKRDLLTRKIVGEHVLLYRCEDGRIAAISNICPHRFAPLHLGKLVGDEVRCRYHGLGFGPHGRCVHNPHGDVIADAAHLRAFPAIERDGFVWVWLGGGAPNEDAIPDMSRFADHPDRHTPRSYFLAKYRYDILIDNLLDLSHANYLHEGSFSSGEPEGAKTEVSTLDNSVTVTRSEWGAPVPPFAKTQLEGVPKIDSVVRIEWFPSQVIRFNLRLKPAGQPLDSDDALNAQFYHIGTPADAGETHYFLGVTRFGGKDSEADAVVARRQLSVINREDGPMLEAVDEIMAQRDFMTMQPLILPVDKGAIQVRRVMKKLLKAESA